MFRMENIRIYIKRFMNNEWGESGDEQLSNGKMLLNVVTDNVRRDVMHWLSAIVTSYKL